MGDLISRETVREHLKKRLLETALNNVGYVTDASEIYEDVANKRIDTWINEVPVAGFWIVRHTDIHIFTHCSNCGANGELTWHYCPMCGAEMELRRTLIYRQRHDAGEEADNERFDKPETGAFDA